MIIFLFFHLFGSNYSWNNFCYLAYVLVALYGSWWFWRCNGDRLARLVGDVCYLSISVIQIPRTSLAFRPELRVSFHVSIFASSSMCGSMYCPPCSSVYRSSSHSFHLFFIVFPWTPSYPLLWFYKIYSPAFFLWHTAAFFPLLHFADPIVSVPYIPFYVQVGVPQFLIFLYYCNVVKVSCFLFLYIYYISLCFWRSFLFLHILSIQK